MHSVFCYETAHDGGCERRGEEGLFFESAAHRLDAARRKRGMQRIDEESYFVSATYRYLRSMIFYLINLLYTSIRTLLLIFVHCSRGAGGRFTRVPVQIMRGSPLRKGQQENGKRYHLFLLSQYVYLAFFLRLLDEPIKKYHSARGY